MRMVVVTLAAFALAVLAVEVAGTFWAVPVAVLALVFAASLDLAVGERD